MNTLEGTETDVSKNVAGSSSEHALVAPKPPVLNWTELLSLGKLQAPKATPEKAQELLENVCVGVLSSDYDPRIKHLFKLFLDGSDGELANYIEHLIGHNPQLVEQLTTEVLAPNKTIVPVTLLLATVLKGSAPAFKALWRLGTRPQNDKLKYSELHWAAMLLRTDILKFVSTEAKRKPWLDKYRNTYGATPKSILTYMIEPSTISISLDGEAPCTTQEEFKSKWAKEFLPTGRWDFDALYHLRMEGDPRLADLNMDPIGKHLSKQCLAQLPYSPTPPVHVVDLTHNDKMKPVPDEIVGQKQAIASRGIEAGELICLYGGEIRKLIPGSKTYVEDMTLANAYIHSVVCCSHDKSNAAPYMNDGRPNVALRPILVQGIPQRAVYALENITAGTPLRQLYTGNWFLLNEIEHVELHPKALEVFIKETNGLKFMSPMIFDGKTAVSFELKSGKCDYTGAKITGPENILNCHLATKRNQLGLGYIFANNNWKYVIDNKLATPSMLLGWLEVITLYKIPNLFHLSPERVLLLKSELTKLL